MITMKQIAELAGVSQATVSRVLSGSPLVSPGTRQIVMELVQQHDYRPNFVAQHLVKKQSFLLGLILPDISNPFFGEIVRQVEREADRNGYNLILCNSDGDLTRERNQLKSLRARQVDGILVVPSSSESPLLKNLASLDLKTVIVTQRHQQFDSVFVSHEAGGRMVAHHLLGLGHTKVLLVGNKGAEKDKFKGFRQVFAEKGLEIHPEQFLDIGSWGHNIIDQIYQASLSYFKRKKRSDVTAVFAVNDLAAFGVIHALKELQIDIPGEVALVGFDDTFIARGTSPALTSVAQPVEEIGRIAMELMLDRLFGRVSGEVRSVQLEPLLITRASTTSTTV